MSKSGWFKSTYSNMEGNCVEVASLPQGGTAVRDSKNPGGAVLTFGRDEWARFTTALKADA